MLVLLSAAKNLNEEKQFIENCTHPIFVVDAEKLINSLRKYSPNKLGELMKLSPVLAALNVHRYKSWEGNHTKAVIPAAFMFNGEVYAGLNAKSFSEIDKEKAQNHLRILSGLYGLLKPYDLVHPYRLEMGTKLKTGKTNNLYEFWGDKIVNEVNSITATHKQELIVNLASNEYFKSINKKKLRAKIITPVFKDFNNGKYKTVMVYAKKARGFMAAYIIKNKIEHANDLIGFDTEGYSYNKEASLENEFVFYRG
jgi:cytoplasmic iron level regulating protein YaaA (DUF328/UPF0246 family)